MTLRKPQLKEMGVKYFPPYKQYYISNGYGCYLNGIGESGSVYYYGSDEDAREALARFIREAKK